MGAVNLRTGTASQQAPGWGGDILLFIPLAPLGRFLVEEHGAGR